MPGFREMIKEICTKMSTGVLLLEVLPILRSEEYAAIGDKMVILTIYGIEKYVFQFCSFIKMAYGRFFGIGNQIHRKLFLFILPLRREV